MVAYATTPGDLEMGREERTVVLVEKRPSSGWMWKVCIALLFLTLCFGGLFLFAWHWSGRPDMLQMLSGKKEALINVEPTETEHHQTLKQIGSNAKAAIHLERRNDKDLENQLVWSKDQGQAFIQGNFRLENNQIIIPDDGLYFVYSQVSFQVPCSEMENPQQPIHLSHRVWWFTDATNKDKTLMNAVRSACHSTAPEDDQSLFNTIYLGAVFQLKRNDKLWTETNQLAQLEADPGKNFFGVFAL